MKHNMKRIMGLFSIISLLALLFVACNPDGGGKSLVSIAVTNEPTKTTYAIGEALDLTGLVVTATYSDGSTEPVTTTNASDFDSTTAGNKTVTITYNEKTATFIVTVTADPIDVTGVELNHTDGTIAVNGEVSLTATITPANATNQTVTWKSSDSSIATVTGTGKQVAVKGLNAGTATITVTTEDGGFTAECAVTVKYLESISVQTQPTRTEYIVGDPFDPTGLVLELIFTDGSKGTVTWSAAIVSSFSFTDFSPDDWNTVLTESKTVFFSVNYCNKTAGNGKIIVKVKESPGYIASLKGYLQGIIDEMTGEMMSDIEDLLFSNFVEGTQYDSNSAFSVDPSTVPRGLKTISYAAINAFKDELDAAQDACDDPEATEASLTAAFENLYAALDTIQSAFTFGTMTLATRIAAAPTGTTIYLYDDEHDFAPVNSYNIDNKNITLEGVDGTRTIFLASSGQGSMFRLGNGASLTLNSVSLEGKTGNNAAVVYVGGTTGSSSTLTMNDGGTEIIGNTNSGNGGGVYVAENGTFIMKGGIITGNTSTSSTGGGGGVYVSDDATSKFYMAGGNIYGNNVENGAVGKNLYRGAAGVAKGVYFDEGGNMHESDDLAGASGGTFGIVDEYL
ncbi:hypothetical protein FACS1894151_10390 [Spirochaetia bacterium]|nr:hypothetical protein FACS1894151_10390 [Spirochaetia bacterium]